MTGTEPATETGATYSRAAAVNAASSLTDSPFQRMAVRNAPTCTGVAWRSIIARIARLASSHVRSFDVFWPAAIFAISVCMARMKPVLLVDAAFGFVEVAPAAGPRIFGGPDRAGAMGAADAGIVLIVQGVV